MRTLPHSGLTVPDSDMRVSVVDQDHRSGRSTGYLQQGPTRIGYIENDGNGGETTFMPNPAAGGYRELMDRVATYADQCHRDGQPVTLEQVLDALVEERSIASAVEHIRSFGAQAGGDVPVRRVTSLGNTDRITQTPTPPVTAAQREQLNDQMSTRFGHESGGRWEFWNGQQWTPLPSADSGGQQ